MSIVKALLLSLSMAMPLAVSAQSGGAPSNLVHKPAARFNAPERAQLLAATSAGSRIVAVGDRGVILLSDDDGVNYRQARSVPTRATLTSVSFVDDKYGWAAGHWGVILHTTDGGETWALQRDDLATDQPLFSVWFKDQQRGFAAGLFALLLTTGDGGKTWEPIQLPSAAGNRSADLNLFSIFPDRRGNVLIAGEQGLVYRSEDAGKTWHVMQTGARGTLWTGRVLDDNSIVVAGLRGNVFRSGDGGVSWGRVEVSTSSSVTDMTQLPNGDLLMVGLDGVALLSKDRGASFSVQQRADQLPLTAVVASSRGTPLLFSQSGTVANK